MIFSLIWICSLQYRTHYGELIIKKNIINPLTQYTFLFNRCPDYIYLASHHIKNKSHPKKKNIYIIKSWLTENDIPFNFPFSSSNELSPFNIKTIIFPFITIELFYTSFYFIIFWSFWRNERDIEAKKKIKKN